MFSGVSGLAHLVALLMPLTAALGQQAGPAESAIAAPRAPERIRVVVEPSIEDADLLLRWIVERHAGLVDALPLAAGYDEWVAVRVEGATYDYRVSVAAVRDGAVVGEVGSAFSCQCNNETLLESIHGEVGKAVEALREPVAAVAGESGMRLDEEEDDLSLPLPARTARVAGPVIEVRDEKAVVPVKIDRCASEDSLCFGPPGVVGAALAGVGGVGVLSGLVMVGVGMTGRSDEPARQGLRVPGYALFGVGAAMIAGGLIVLGRDLMRCRRGVVAKRCRPWGSWWRELGLGETSRRSGLIRFPVTVQRDSKVNLLR